LALPSGFLNELLPEVMFIGLFDWNGAGYTLFSIDFLLQSLVVVPGASCMPGDAPLKVVPGENKLPLDDWVMLLPLVSLMVAPLLKFMGDAGTMPFYDPDVAPAEGIYDPFRALPFCAKA